MKQVGRGYAYLGMVSGGVVSIAANIAHSWIKPSDAPAGWSPAPGSVVSSIVWPLFALLSVEILAKTTWPPGWLWRLVRFIGLLPVGAVAASVSYRHLSALLAFYGEDRWVTVVGPLAVDGLLLVSTAAIIAHQRQTAESDNQPAIPEPVIAPVVLAAAIPQPTAEPEPVTTPTPAKKPLPPIKALPAKGSIVPIPRGSQS